MWAEFSSKARIPFIVFSYIPHFGRAAPYTDDTFAELRDLMAKFKTKHGDWVTIAVIGDFNARLARVYDYTRRKRVLNDGDDVELEVTGC